MAIEGLKIWIFSSLILLGMTHFTSKAPAITSSEMTIAKGSVKISGPWQINFFKDKPGETIITKQGLSPLLLADYDDSAWYSGDDLCDIRDRLYLPNSREKIPTIRLMEKDLGLKQAHFPGLTGGLDEQRAWVVFRGHFIIDEAHVGLSMNLYSAGQNNSLIIVNGALVGQTVVDPLAPTWKIQSTQHELGILVPVSGTLLHSGKNSIVIAMRQTLFPEPNCMHVLLVNPSIPFEAEQRLLDFLRVRLSFFAGGGLVLMFLYFMALGYRSGGHFEEYALVAGMSLALAGCLFYVSDIYSSLPLNGVYQRKLFVLCGHVYAALSLKTTIKIFRDKGLDTQLLVFSNWFVNSALFVGFVLTLYISNYSSTWKVGGLSLSFFTLVGTSLSLMLYREARTLKIVGSKILAFGFVLVFLTMLEGVANFILRYSLFWTFPYAAILLMLCYSFFFSRQFRLLHENVARLKTQLEHILASTREMASHHQRLTVASHAAAYILPNISLAPSSQVDLYLGTSGINQHVPRGKSRIVADGQVVAEPKYSALEDDDLDFNPQQENIKSSFLLADRKLVVPLVWANAITGYLVLAPYDRSILVPEEAHFMNMFAMSLALSFENIHFIECAEDRVRDEQDMKAASAVQNALLAQSMNYPGVDIASFYQPAAQTGGDWLGTFYNRHHHELLFYLGDVTGHGISAALLTGVACGAVASFDALMADLIGKGLQFSSAERLCLLAQILNRVFLERPNAQHWMTMMFQSLNLSTGQVTQVNAGQTLPLRLPIDGGKPQVLVGLGSVLGASSSPLFIAKEYLLNPGETVFLYTDGLIENEGIDDLCFDEKILKATLTHKFENAHEILSTVMEKARSIWQNRPGADDVAILIYRWHGPVAREEMMEVLPSDSED